MEQAVCICRAMTDHGVDMLNLSIGIGESVEYIIPPASVPDGWNAEIVTKEMPVEVRGSQELIDELTEENIRVVADLQHINQAAGQYTVPVSIYLDSAGSNSEIGVMNNSNYSVVVTLTPA